MQHKTENIYVADQSNNRVQVFNREVKSCLNDKMKQPLCIAIYKTVIDGYV